MQKIDNKAFALGILGLWTTSGIEWAVELRKNHASVAGTSLCAIVAYYRPIIGSWDRWL